MNRLQTQVALLDDAAEPHRNSKSFLTKHNIFLTCV